MTIFQRPCGGGLPVTVAAAVGPGAQAIWRQHSSSGCEEAADIESPFDRFFEIVQRLPAQALCENVG